ncbi:hypothetical protein TNIN_483251 [Trichonephila inaurata madagascariensis]|uniref:Uncharacterized protein n=1 Tax=Trichonephila inaurata madagascariensis TaxID=2747483 RepID=A0A8X6Y4X8_9ARAC|nr:hypothetical protein TNIN_483251 [Trichonephila inaurata madagascariensis]
MPGIQDSTETTPTEIRAPQLTRSPSARKKIPNYTPKRSSNYDQKDSIMKNEQLILSVVDYILLVAMLFVSAGIGLYFQLTSKKKTNEEYLLAGKDMSPPGPFPYGPSCPPRIMGPPKNSYMAQIWYS